MIFFKNLNFSNEAAGSCLFAYKQAWGYLLTLSGGTIGRPLIRLLTDFNRNHVRCRNGKQQFYGYSPLLSWLKFVEMNSFADHILARNIGLRDRNPLKCPDSDIDGHLPWGSVEKPKRDSAFSLFALPLYIQDLSRFITKEKNEVHEHQDNKNEQPELLSSVFQCFRKGHRFRPLQASEFSEQL